MSPLAHALLCASRYAHLRSLHPYEHVIAATQEVWHLLDDESRRYLLTLWREQVPRELRGYAERQGASMIPVSAGEALDELAAWERLFAWCEGARS